MKRVLAPLVFVLTILISLCLTVGVTANAAESISVSDYDGEFILYNSVGDICYNILGENPDYENLNLTSDTLSNVVAVIFVGFRSDYQIQIDGGEASDLIADHRYTFNLTFAVTKKAAEVDPEQPSGTACNVLFYIKNIVVDTKSVAKNITVTAPEASALSSYIDEGYKISGWRLEGESSNYDFSAKVNADIKLFANVVPRTFNVRFDLGAGALEDGILDQTVSYKASAVAPSITAPTGYVFSGWDAGFASVTSDLTINAVYAPLTPSVKFFMDNACVYSYNVSYGGKTSASCADGLFTVPNGKLLAGWKAQDALDLFDFDTPITSDLSLFAVLDEASYPVNFDIGEGTLTSGSLTQTVLYGESASAPVVAAPNGFSYAWDKSFDNITAAVTIKAVYSPITPSVSFYDSEILLYSAVLTYNQELNAPSASAFEEHLSAPTGYELSGWRKGDSNALCDFPLNITADTVFYAVWEPIILSVSYMVDGEPYIDPALTSAVRYGERLHRQAEPEKTNFVFNYWSGYSSLSSEYDYTAPITDNLTLYAKFTPIYYLITAQASLGASLRLSLYSAKCGDTVTFSYQLSEGYALTDISLSSPDGAAVSYKDNGFTMPDSDLKIVLTAQKYSIKVLATDNAEQFVTYGNAPVLTEPEASGKEFVGWYLDENFSLPFNGVATAAKDETLYLYAKFVSSTALPKYDITFVLSADGSKKYTAQVSHGELPTPPTIASTTKETFNGWDKSIVEATESATYVALFEQIKYTLTLVNSDNGTLSYVGTPVFGELIAVSAKTDDGYEVKSVALSGNIELTALGENSYTFVMPAENVTITLITKASASSTPSNGGVTYGGADNGAASPAETEAVTNGNQADGSQSDSAIEVSYTALIFCIIGVVAIVTVLVIVCVTLKRKSQKQKAV